MKITRRQFAVSASLVSLAVLGCERDAAEPEGSASKPDTAANLATEPFDVGPLQQYREPGVYPEFKPTHGVWLVSDGQKLIALSATCTHIGCTTDWNITDQVFECPCHHSTFDTEGRQGEDAKAKRPLERCMVTVVDSPQIQFVRVDPTKRFDETQWDEPGAAVAF